MRNKEKNEINEKGITLVALIITIIILVILTAVSIVSVYKSKIVEYAIKGAQDYAIEGVSENRVLEGTENLIESAIENLKKVTNAETVNENIKLKTEKIFEEDCTKGKIHIEIEYQGIIESIYINDKQIEVPEKTNGVYIVEEEVTENGMYIVIVKDANGDYQIANVKVSEILGDMKIYDEADMELFRERVNEGKIFVSTKVEVMKDITLTKEWETIGTVERQFLGEFEGNGHSIKGLRMEAKADNQGLFSYNSGTIKNLKIEEGNIKSNYTNIGMICGTNSGTIENIEISGMVQGKNYTGGIAGVSLSGSKILNCQNSININENDYANSVVNGGIVGNGQGATIENCINKGNIYGKSHVGGISGIRGIFNNCGNTGNIVCKGYFARRYSRIWWYYCRKL